MRKFSPSRGKPWEKAREKAISTTCVENRGFIEFSFISLSRDRICKDCEFFFFFVFFISLRLTCTGRTRSQQSVYSWRICRRSATLPCTRSSRNSSSRNGSTSARGAPCTLDRFWNERRRLCIINSIRFSRKHREEIADQSTGRNTVTSPMNLKNPCCL